jgi:hypothetical protein
MFFSSHVQVKVISELNCWRSEHCWVISVLLWFLVVDLCLYQHYSRLTEYYAAETFYQLAFNSLRLFNLVLRGNILFTAQDFGTCAQRC